MVQLDAESCEVAVKPAHVCHIRITLVNPQVGTGTRRHTILNMPGEENVTIQAEGHRVNKITTALSDMRGCEKRRKIATQL